MTTDWRSRALPVDDVAARVPNGANMFVHGAAATPTPLLEAVCRRTDLEAVRAYHLHLEGGAALAAPEVAERVFSISLFTGPDLRVPIAEGRADFMPVFLSEIPDLFRRRVVDLDVALLQLSPPDRHGWCTLGTSIDAALDAARSARLILAEINERMPRTHGNTTIRFDRIDAFCATDRPLPQRPAAPESEVVARIGDQVAALIEDGSVIQAGIGEIPNAVLRRLHGKRDLGIHTEMFSDGVVELVRSGAVTNADKDVHPHRIVTSFVTGTDITYDFCHDNPRVEFHPCDRTNDVQLIARMSRVVAINSALEIDLSGQVCADSIGARIYSGIGGQMDFVKGASMSPGGKAILALPSTAAGGKVSRIATTLKPGAGVVTTRGHVRWVVTEFGAVDLHGRTLRERADLLIAIAHPDFRPQLGRELRELRHFPVC